MPINNSLEKANLPMELKFCKEPETVFMNNLDAINVKLIDAPTHAQLRRYIPAFVEATWSEDPIDAMNFDDNKKDEIIIEMMKGNALPTALETIGLTFLIEGISIQEVTHLLRHRMASFSADCSGDKWWSDKPALVPSSIEMSEEFYERYWKLVDDAKHLYCDMIDSKKISLMDARYILPRCLSTFYFMRMNLKDAIAFLRQRLDRQIQPETDNVIAMNMALEILRHIPTFAFCGIDFDEFPAFYAKMARTGKATNLYFPEEKFDNFEYNENDFIYQCKREDMTGTNKFSYYYFAYVYERISKEYNDLKEYNIQLFQQNKRG